MVVSMMNRSASVSLLTSVGWFKGNFMGLIFRNPVSTAKLSEAEVVCVALGCPKPMLEAMVTEGRIERAC